MTRCYPVKHSKKGISSQCARLVTPIPGCPVLVSQVPEVSVIQFVGSVCRPSCSSLQSVVMPGVAFPPAGSLGLSSPPSSVLRSTTTTSRPSPPPSLSLGLQIPCLEQFVCGLPRGLRSSLLLLVTAKSFGLPVSLPLPVIVDKETVGPPKSLSYPFDDMHRSQIPVVPSTSAIAAEGYCLPNSSKSSAFSVWLTDY